jgi:hypothetical protein
MKNPDKEIIPSRILKHIYKRCFSSVLMVPFCAQLALNIAKDVGRYGTVSNTQNIAADFFESVDKGAHKFL